MTAVATTMKRPVKADMTDLPQLASFVFIVDFRNITNSLPMRIAFQTALESITQKPCQFHLIVEYQSLSAQPKMTGIKMCKNYRQFELINKAILIFGGRHPINYANFAEFLQRIFDFVEFPIGRARRNVDCSWPAARS
ncbi:MAG: hypothetical protein QF582_09495 [Alphaproteobacteria bacterium]|jgi:hypothetical protein|nr:hypothetical protein [Alphaproteobacteria bacterium]